MDDTTDAGSTIRVAGICGSLREGSYTRVTLERALAEAANTGAATDLIDLRDLELPTYDADVDRADAGDAEELAARVREADAILLGSPMYHGSYSSPLKTALDYCGAQKSKIFGMPKWLATLSTSRSSRTRPSVCSRWPGARFPSPRSSTCARSVGRSTPG